MIGDIPISILVMTAIMFGVAFYFMRQEPGQNKQKHLGEAPQSTTPTCPRCGSAAVTGSSNGYNTVRGILWALLLGVGGYWVFSEYWDRAVVSFYHVFGDDVYRFLRPISSTTAAAFFATLGVLTGLRIGSAGSKRVKVTCLNCGCRYDPAVRHLYDEIRMGSTKAQAAPGPKAAQPRSGWDDPPIPPGFAEYLRETGQDDPRYSGRNNALECVLIDMADDKERAVMWAYAVDCARHDRTMGNILHAPDYFKYRAFGEYASRHGDVLASVADRRAYEYWSPTTTTKAYRAAREFLG